ncbi:MAG: hypothetical protein Kow009_04180 [Spirochaetales bacterium]
MKAFPLAILLTLALLLFPRCTARTDFTLESDGSGTVNLQIDLSPVLVRYYSDLATGFLPDFDPAHPRIFDLDALKARFAREKNLTLLSARTPSPERLEASFAFQDLRTLFTDSNVGNAITLSQTDREETIRIRLNRDTLNTIFALSPDTESPIYRMLLPPPDGSLSEEDYRDQLVWALEEYASEEELSATLRASRIQVRVHTPGPILRHRGGVMEGASTVRFTLPLLSVLTAPQAYELTYRR